MPLPVGLPMRVVPTKVIFHTFMTAGFFQVLTLVHVVVFHALGVVQLNALWVKIESCCV